MELTKKDKGFVSDIILNMDEPFTAKEVQDVISKDYGVYYDVAAIEGVMTELTEMELLEPDRCDKTVDLFGSLNASFSEQFA